MITLSNAWGRADFWLIQENFINNLTGSLDKKRH